MVMSIISTVGKSTMERFPRTTTAPVIVPIAAAVTPSIKATRPGFFPCLRKYGDEIADETHGDHDGPRRDHGDRDCVDELPLVQPVMLVDDPAVQERNDRKSAAEHECARLGEE